MTADREAENGAGDVPSQVEGSHNLETLVESSRAALGADAIVVAVGPPGGEEPAITARGVDEAEASGICAALAPLEPILVERGAVSVADLAREPEVGDGFDWERHGLSTMVSATLRWDGDVLGSMHALNPDPGRIGDEAGGLVAVANQTALAVAFARLRHKTIRLSAELESVMALDELVLTATTIDDLGHLLTERLAAILGAATGGIMVFDEERNVLQMLPGAFGVSDDAAVSCRINADHPRSNSARVFKSGEPYVSNEAQGDPGIIPDYVDLFHVERLLSLPLRLGSRRVGVLHLANKPSPFTPYDVYRAEMLVPRIATVVELGTTVLQLRRHQRATEVLVELALGVASGKEMFELISGALERLGDVIETSLLAVVPASGEPMVWRREGVENELEKRLMSEAATRSSLMPRVAEPREAGDPGYATLFVPVRLAGKRIATIATLRRRADPFVEVERDTLMRMANLIAVGWATENYQRQRAEMATLRERQRIADDLHDTVAQIMFGAQINLDSVLELDDVNPVVRGEVLHARGLLTKGDSAIRGVIHQLSRPIRGDLSQRLTLVAESIQDEFRVGIRLDVPPPVNEAAKSLRRPVVDALVKTAQEAVVNAAKHAGPCAITVRLSISRRGRLVLTVLDDGIGRNGAGGRGDGNGYGLGALRRTLRERGGILRVSSIPSGGTKVIASVPL